MYLTLQDEALHREGLLKLINEGLESVPATDRILVPNKIGSKQAYEQVKTHGGLQMFGNMAEEGGVPYDSPKTRFTKTIRPVIRALGIKYSNRALYKDLYNFVKSYAPMLAKSHQATRNYLAAQLLNTGNDSASPQRPPDGSAQFSATHTLQDATTVSNLGTQALSGIALENAIMAVNAQLGDRSLPWYNMDGYYVVVGPLAEGPARRAVESAGLQGTTDNDKNALIIKTIKSVVVDKFLGWGNSALANNWFLLPASAQDSPFVSIEVAPLKVDSDFDIDHQVHKFVASFEAAYDSFGWRGTYGVFL